MMSEARLLRPRRHGVPTAFKLGVVDGPDASPVRARVDGAQRRKADDARTIAEQLGDSRIAIGRRTSCAGGRRLAISGLNMMPIRVINIAI